MDKKYIILLGGSSNERLVSVASAQFIAQALGDAKCWFWHKNHAVYEIAEEKLLLHEDPFIREFIPENNPLFSNIEQAIKSPLAEDHVFILAVHGGQGENGFVQALLEESKRLFTGSGSLASQKAFDKIAAKNILSQHHVNLAPSIELAKTDYPGLIAQITDFMSKNGPAIAKPIEGGSSLGCLFIKDKSAIGPAIEQILSSPENYMLEKLIMGREITIGVIENSHGITALPATEIIIDKARDFDYDGKYLGQGAKEVTPADLPEPIERECQRLAIAAHTALSLYGYSRTDMILDGNSPVFLEINSLPGLSKASLVPQQLAEAKISMRQFLEEQIELAKARFQL